MLFHALDQRGRAEDVHVCQVEDERIENELEDSEVLYYDEYQRQRSCFSSFPVSPVLQLKKGVNVVLMANVDKGRGLVTGCFGEIVGFRSAEDMKEEDQLWGEKGREFPWGQDRAFVRKHWAKVHPARRWPMVRWLTGRGKVTTFVFPTKFSTEDSSGNPICSRVQLPLLMTSGMTVHKSQGMTLSGGLVFHCTNVFVPGQLYIALSRGCAFDRLRITGRISQDMVLVSPAVVEFDRSTDWKDIDNRIEMDL